MTPVLVGVLAYDGCLGTEVFGVADLLLFANRIARTDLFLTTVVARGTADIVTASGVALRAARWDEDIDALVVPGFELRSPHHIDRALDRWRPEIAYIASAAAPGVPGPSRCVGAVLTGGVRLLCG